MILAETKKVEMKSNYPVPKGIWIPDIYIEKEELSFVEMGLLSIIKSLSEQGICFARNNYFASVMHVNNRTITRTITALEEKKLIVIKNGSNQQRIIQLYENVIEE